MTEAKTRTLLMGIRHALLTALDAIEIFLGETPTTSQIRDYFKRNRLTINIK